MNQETQNIRDLQLQEYRAEQQKMADYLRPAQAPIQRVPVSVIISKAKELVDEITALNVSSLNLRGGTPARIDTDGHLNQKINQLYQVLHQLKTEHGYNGKII